MLLVQGLTADPLQKMRLVLPDGSALSLTIYFVPMQLSWFITNLTYGEFSLNGLRISTNPNLLFQYMNQIPFGLACYTTALRDPQLQRDFQSGASRLFLLTAEECTAYAELLSQ
jgi:hypothetical protein